MQNPQNEAFEGRDADVGGSAEDANKEAVFPQNIYNQPSKGQAWSISFAPSKLNPTRARAARREREAMLASRLQRVDSAIQTPTSGEELQGEDEGVSGTAKAITRTIDGSSFFDKSIAIPRNLMTTQSDMDLRNYIDHQQMICMVRQYKASCGVSSLTSVWNRLYSVLGGGSLPPVSQEEVMCILGFEPPFETIKWGPFTGNTTLMRWFHVLNKHFGVTGKASFLYKVHGVGRTMHITSTDQAKSELYDAIRSPHCGVIYHCLNHYMVPMGFIDSARSQLEVYAKEISDPESFIVIGEVSRGKHPPMHVKKWEDVVTDLNTSSPQFFNIRQSELGVQTRGTTDKGSVVPRSSTVGRNMHCLMLFRSDVAEEDIDSFIAACSGDLDGDEEEDHVDEVQKHM